MRPEESAVLLLHCYPSDLKVGRSELQTLISRYSVRLIDMGHTHYNEIANDGHLLYTATRSTGQIEEGPVGFSITNIDGPAISWKFLPLATLPAAMITSPAEARLIPDTHSDGLISSGTFFIRAKVFSASPVKSIEAEYLGATVPLVQVQGSSVYQAEVPAGNVGVHSLAVMLVDEAGGEAKDMISVVVGGAAFKPSPRQERDQDNAVEAWPERGLLGTQLGPNKNGRKW